MPRRVQLISARIGERITGIKRSPNSVRKQYRSAVQPAIIYIVEHRWTERRVWNTRVTNIGSRHSDGHGRRTVGVGIQIRGYAQLPHILRVLSRHGDHDSLQSLLHPTQQTYASSECQYFLSLHIYTSSFLNPNELNLQKTRLTCSLYQNFVRENFTGGSCSDVYEVHGSSKLVRQN